MKRIQSAVSGFILGLAILGVHVAHGAELTFSLLIDTDQSASSGCSVATPTGNIAGIERRINVVVQTTTTSASVLRTESQSCAVGTFGAPAIIDVGPWNVGIGNGNAGSAVVEFSLPLSLLPSTGAVQAWIVANNSVSVVDQAGAFTVTLGAASDNVSPVPLSPWLMAFVGCALAVWGMRSVHRFPVAMVLASVTLGVSFVVWAATIVRDGNVGDWAGISPIINDGRGESNVIDIVSVYTQRDSTHLHLRVDAVIALEALPNAAPIVSAGAAQTINASTLPVSFGLAGSASDDAKPNPPGALTLSWSKVSGPGTVSFTNAASSATNASVDVVGTYVLRLTATDGALTSTSDVTITVNLASSDNAAPVVSAGADQSSATGAGNFTLSGTVSDDGKPTPSSLTSTWSLVSGPVFDVAFANRNAPATTVTLPVIGTYVLRLTASDGALTSTDDLTIVVNDAPPRMASLPSRTIPVGVNFKQALSGNDPNPQDLLTFALITAPSGATLTPNQVFDWTPNNAQLGPHTITARATDRNGNTDSKSFTLTVVAQNRRPVLAAQADISLAQGTTFSRTLTATDPDGDSPLTFSIVSGPAGMSLSGTTLSWPVGSVTPGLYRATVQVRDPAGLSDSKTFNLTVGISAPPVAVDDSYSVQLGTTLTVPTAQGVLLNDVSLDGLSLTAAKQSDPSKGVVSAFNTDGSFTYTAPATAAPNTFNPTLVKQHQIFDASTTHNWQLADLNGDGHADIVFNHLCFSVRGCITAFDIKNNAQLWTTSASADGCTIAWTSNAAFSMAVGDIDDDGIPDIVVVGHCGVQNTSYDRILAFNGRTGALKWQSPSVHEPAIAVIGPAGLHAETALTIARLRTGEKPSILLGRATAGLAGRGENQRLDCAAIVENVPDGYYQAAGALSPHYYSCAGVIVLAGENGAITQRMIQDAGNFGAGASSLWRGKSDTGFIFPALALDFTGSGQNKFMMNGALWNLDGTKFGASNPSHLHALAVGNFDDLPDIEMVIIEQTPSGMSLKVKKADGRLLWSMPLPTINIGHVTVADIDGDGKPEILVSMVLGSDEVIWALDYRGRLRWTHALPCSGGCAGFTFFLRRLAAFDLDGDGVAEVIFPYGNQLRFLDGLTGAVKGTVPTLQTQGTGAAYEAIARVADVDNDGHADVVIVSSGLYNCGFNPGCVPNVMVFSDGAKQWRPTRKIDNQFAYFGANVNDDGTIPTAVPLPNDFATSKGNVFAGQPQTLLPVDPRLRDQTSFTYTASSGALSSTPATVKITIDPPNRPPKFTSTPPTRHNVTLNYQAVAVDPDVGDTITYAIETQVNASGIPCLVVANTGLVTCTRLDNADALIILSATDSFGAKAFHTLLLQPSTTSCIVPNLIGQTQSAAATAINTAGCSVGDVSETNSPASAGTVLSSVPIAGTTILGGEAVSIVVSKGPLPVAVPAVVGLTESIARTRLQSAGFTPSVSRVFSNTIASGEVISQSVSAGTLATPGAAPIGIVVSAGSGLTLRLNRSLATADQTITVIPEAFDLGGAAVALPSLTFAITEAITGFGAPLPTISGTTISSSATTLGTYRVTATDTVGGRSASATFVVSNAPGVDGVTHFQSYAAMTEALDAIYALRPQLVAARAANDTATMTALVRQMVTTWRAVDIEDVKLSMSIVPVDQFPPSVDDLRALGLSPTAQDLAVNAILKEAVSDLKAWTAGLNTEGTSLAQLDLLADQFNTRIARLNGLSISEFGGILNEKEYTLLLSHLIPNFYEAFFNEVGQTVGLAPRAPFFDRLKKSRSVSADTPKSTLSEQLVTLAVDKIVEKVMEQVNERVRNAKQFTVDIMGQAQWSAAAVAAAAHLKSTVHGGDITEVVSGASLSFRVFNEPTPNWATIEVPDTMDEPLLWGVLIVGPDTVADVSNGIQGLFAELKAGVNFGIDPLQNPKKYRNRNALKKHWKELKGKIKTAQAAANTLQDTIENAYQTPDEVFRGCVFTSDPNCAQLYYDGGFDPVYRYTPPSGFNGFSGIPVPIIFVVQNQLNGMMYFGTPPFLPAPKKP